MGVIFINYNVRSGCSLIAFDLREELYLEAVFSRFIFFFQGKVIVIDSKLFEYFL